MALRLPPRGGDRPQMDSALAVVNIVLLMLFFFMAVGQGARPAAELSLATTQGLPLEQLPKPILVVRGPRAWELDGRPVAPDLVPAAVPGGVLHLMIDRHAPAGLLLETLRHPALAGHDLRLVTLKAASGP